MPKDCLLECLRHDGKLQRDGTLKCTWKLLIRQSGEISFAMIHVLNVVTCSYIIALGGILRNIS